MIRLCALRALSAAVLAVSCFCAALAEAPERSPRPVSRPPPDERQAAPLPPPVIEPVTPEAPVLPPQIYGNGHLCGDPALTGVPLKPIRGAARGCGIAEPVQITAVGGVGLSRPINLDCPTARALRLWVDLGVKPAIGPLGGGLTGLEVAAAYSCRPRNNIRGRRMSEHGRGRAVDVFGFTLLNGQTLTVLERWRPTATRGLFRQLHATACGPFGTVLGPAADRHHRDHFHLDTQRRRNGDYCR
jgi:hypothetical protein